MKELREFKSAAMLGSMTAAVALLVGLSSASAQAPVSTAPTLSGAGSFPGSFVVPGTQTSLRVGGLVYFDLYYDMSTRDGADSASDTGVPVEGSGTAQPTGGHQTTHGIRMKDNTARPTIETRTPTSWGEVKTYIEFDFQGTGGAALGGALAGTTAATACCVDGEIPRLRQAYGTFGPLLIGQALSLFSDVDAWSDGLDPSDPGWMGVGTNRKPQIRYTYLWPNGITSAFAFEEPISGGVFSTTAAGTGFTTANAAAAGAADVFGWNSFSNPGWMMQHWPAMVTRTRIDQPWGHASVQLAVQEDRLETTNAIFSPATTGLGNNGGHESHWGYQFATSGHLNTWGRDRFTWYFNYGQGAGTYSSDVFVGGPSAYFDSLVCSVVDALGNFKCSQPRNAGLSASYTHNWTDEWRSTVAYGYSWVSKPDAAATWTYATPAAGTNGLAALEDKHYTAHVNLQWSPTPNTNFGIEYQFYHRVVQSGAQGSHHRIETQVLFKF